MASAHSHATRRGLTTRVRGQSGRTRLAGRSDIAGEIARYLGAGSIVVVGAIHLQQYYDAYFSAVPTIGTLFLLTFIGSAMVGATLIAPVRRLGRTIGDLRACPKTRPGGVRPGSYARRVCGVESWGMVLGWRWRG